MIKEKTWCVYMHTNKINNKKYIGISSNIKSRWKGNGIDYKRQVIGRAFDKYGWDNFEHEILFENLSQEEAEKKEIEMISFYQSNNKLFGYNISQGGENGHNELWNNPEYKATQAKERKDRWNNAEYREKIAISMKTAMSKDEYKQKQSNNTKERWDNGVFDGVFCKSVICLETGIIYKSIHEAGELTNTCRTDIGKCCNKKMKTANGYHWIFYTGEDYTYDDRMFMIEQIGKGRGIKIMCVETGIKYNSIQKAADDVGTDNSTIAKVLKGKRQTAGGFHWVYC